MATQRRPQARRGALPSRRDALQLTGVTAAASLVGCDALSTDPAGDDPNVDNSSPKGDQAPELAERVEAGELPPVQERLPRDPLTIEPLDEIGQYGGAWNLALMRDEISGEGDRLYTMIGYEQILRWQPGTTSLTDDAVIPNLAADFAIEADGAEYVFTLRDGLKWSDGEPFTADDILFWYEAVLTNDELTPEPVDWLTTDDDLVVVEKEDELTIRFVFSQPNGLFLTNMAAQRGGDPTQLPAHYLRQFHPDYNDDIDNEVASSEFDDWMDLFEGKRSLWNNSELPVLNAWMLESPIDAGTERVAAVRNPYYWKVDPDGSQLPYISRVVFAVFESAEPAMLSVTSGEIDTVDRGINDLTDKPIYARSRDQGDYDFFETIPQQMNQMIIQLNLTHGNPVMREVFSAKDFRIGLSHAINREEIIDTVYAAQGEPWQAAPRPESEYYNERLAKQYTEFDLTEAEAYLDRVVPDKDSQGQRLLPNGEPVSFHIEVTDSAFVEALELIRQTWQEVGIEMRSQNQDYSLFEERILANDHDACAWVGGGGLGAPLDPFYYMPHNFNTRYAILWHYWYLDPNDERAVEPPEPTKRQIELYRQMLVTGDAEERESLMHEILEIAADEFYCMGLSLRQNEYGIFSNRLRNVPQTSVTGWLHAELMPNNPQQFFVVDS